MPDPLFGKDELLQGDPTVQGLNLQTLLDRLGVKAVVRHVYEPLVLPVAIVDAAAVSLSANVTPQTLGLPASQGIITAGAAGTLLADTGQLAAGNWNVEILVAGTEPAALSGNMVLARRNAANNADIWAQLIGSSFTASRISVALNERIIVRINRIVGANIDYQASIWSLGPF